MSTPLYLGDKDSPKYAPIMKFSTLIKLSLSAAALLCSAASAQATVVSWDGTSTDITSLSSNVNVSSSGGSVWVASNGIWDTTDLTFAAIGSQAALQVAYSQIQQTHKTIQINHGGNALLAAGGGSSSQGKIDVTAGFSTVYAFDTSTFSASEVLANMSVTVHERTTSDVCSFRWFVVAGGTTYVSASVAADVGGTLTEYTLADAASETWYAFDGSVNIESAVGASVGTLSLTNVTYAGIMATVDTLGSASNWRGLYVDKFSAEATSPPTTVQTNAVYADVTGAAAFTSATDLANQGQATFASSTVSANQDPGTPEGGFNDGVTESNKGSMTWFRDDVTPTQFPGEIVLNLDVSTNSAGYNITTINSIAGYNIGGLQADQVMTVEYSVVGDASYTTLGTYSNEAADTLGQYSSISLAHYLNGNLLSGVDSLRFTYANPAANTRLVIQEIDVIGSPTNQAPTADAQSSVQAAINTPLSITLTGSDPEGSSLTYSVGTPTNGTLSGTAPDLTYTPSTDYTGSDSFTFTVNDGTTDSAPATVSIFVSNTVQTNAVYADVTGAAAFTSATDLANQGQATFASSTVSANQDPGTPEGGFNDGVTESNKGSMTWFRDDVTPTQFPGEIVLNLDVSTNSAGYNITSINSIAGYNAGGAQADQVMTVEYSVVGDASYTTLGTYSNEAADTQGQYSSISLTHYLNGNLLFGVDSLRFTYANPAANTRLALQEIDVIGGAVQATNYESDLASVQAATSAADLVDSSQATYASSTITANQGGDTAATEDVNDGVTATDLNNATWFRDDQTPAQFPAEVVLNLDVTTNTNGYNISEINSIAGWNNAQHDQVMTVEYSIVGSADWVSIGQFTNIPSTASYSRIHLSSSPAGYLANSVDALRFTYADPDLAATGHRIVLQEIDVIGAPAGAFPPTLTVDALSNDMLIEPSQATTVTGTSTAGAGITVAFSGQSKTTTAAGDGSWSVSLDAEVANSTGQVLTVTANLNSLTTVASYTNVVVGYQPIDLQLSSMFSDDMILQREKAVPVWGTSSASAGITVEFDGQTKTTTAAGDGTWTVSLDSMVASITSRVLTVTASLNGGTTVLTYNNVLVGEVWLCSGQSNMAWQNNQSDHQATVEATPNNPTLRFYKVPLLSQGTPVAHINTVWTESTTGSSGTATAFSAVAYFFGLKLQDELESSEGADVPIGLIQSAKGGSQIETWMPAGTVYNSGAAGGYYNGQIDALIPFAMRGVIWYQGEANLSDGMAYVPKQKALIDGWRALWLEDFPFYYVQLAPRSGPGETKPIFWEAQSAVLDQVAGTGMAVITDTWNGTEGIHPGNKQPVGERLGLLALDNTYGQDIVSTGPTFQSIRLSGSTLEVTFDSAVGLTPASPDYFEIAGADGTYVAATATVSGNKLVLSNAAVALPVSMRFAWIDTAQPNLRNAAGLVPSAFRATSPRGTWLAANSLTDSDWENNADGDGNSNLLEFAFGTDPAVSNNNSIGYGSGVTPGLPLPVLETITSNNVDFRAVFGRRKNWSVAGLSYTPQFSPDLTEWVDVTTTPTLIESGSGDIDAVFVPYPMIIQTTTGWEKPQFFRLSVSQD